MKWMTDILQIINDRLEPYEIVLTAAIAIAAIVVTIVLYRLSVHKKSNTSTQASQKDNKGQTIGTVHGDLHIGTLENKFDEETRQKIDAIYNKIQEGSFSTKNESNPIEKRDIFAIVGDLLTTTNERRQPIARALESGNIDEADELLKKLDEEQEYALESLTQERVTTKLERAVLLTWSDPNESYRLLKDATELDSENLQALNQLGHISSRLGKMNDAASAYQQGLAIARRNHDRAWQGAFLANLGLVYLDLGDYEQAKKYHLNALAISREIGDRQREGNHLGSLGLVFDSLGDYEQAKKYHLDALEISREIGDRRSEGIHLGNLGSVYLILSDYEQAKKYHLDALAISHEIGDKQGEGSDLGNLGVMFKQLGDLPATKEYWQQSLAIFEDIGSPEAKQVRESLEALDRQ